jgi:hypothetical protein
LPPVGFLLYLRKPYHHAAGRADFDGAFPLLGRELGRASDLLLRLRQRRGVPDTLVQVGSAEFQRSSAHLELSTGCRFHDCMAYAGLARTRPALATALTLAFLSFIGIPPLASFSAKLALFGPPSKADMHGWLSWRR